VVNRTLTMTHQRVETGAMAQGNVANQPVLLKRLEIAVHGCQVEPRPGRDALSHWTWGASVITTEV